MTAAQDIETFLARLTSGQSKRSDGTPTPLFLDWPELERALPDGGLPQGVVELTAHRVLGGATSIALAAVRAGQALSMPGERAQRGWCAWVDPEATLHAPGVVAAGVDIERMLVVQPPRSLLGRIALKLVATGAFEVVVVDMDAVGVHPSEALRRPEIVVRQLALAAESSGATVLLLTDASRPRASPWPVALRLELSRPDSRSLVVRVAKDRRGRIGMAKTVPFRPVLRIAG